MCDELGDVRSGGGLRSGDDAAQSVGDIELARLAKLVRTPVLIDGRNVFDKNEARRAGFVYKGVGNA